MWAAVDPVPPLRRRDGWKATDDIEPDATRVMRGGGPQGHNSPQVARRRLHRVHGWVWTRHAQPALKWPAAGSIGCTGGCGHDTPSQPSSGPPQAP
jgi:hypothetical protein